MLKHIYLTFAQQFHIF